MGYWTPELIVRLTDSARAGESAAQIARTLTAETQETFSRNAVIGKLFRLGISGKAVRPQEKALPIVRPARQPVAVTYPPAPESPPEPPEAQAVSSGRPVTILQMTHRQCRWPLWGEPDEPRFYCGADRDQDTSYCKGHHARSISKGTVSERNALATLRRHAAPAT